MRSKLQRQHEEYWGRCWAVALAQHFHAEVRWARPNQDPPDCSFHVTHQDGRVMTCWGEITGAYNSPNDAEWLWDIESTSGDREYLNPDSDMAESAQGSVERKLEKYGDLVQHRGRGHLLVLLLSPLTTRSTRASAEQSILDLLQSHAHSISGPFETIWLAYNLPYTSLEESENPKHAFRESSDSHRFNFIKCIWNRSDSRTHD